MSASYLGLHGVAFTDLADAPDNFFWRDPQGTWLPKEGNHFFEIDNICAQLHDAFEEKIFGTMDAYWDFIRVAPDLLSTAGMNSECALSKEVFSKLLPKLSTYLPVNQGLYVNDCRKLVSSIQECTKEVTQLQGEFYQALNLETLFFPEIDEPDGTRWVTSPVATKIFALLGFIYIRLHSLLDYSTKLAVEIENIKTQFEKYPKLSSRGCLYGDRKRVSLNGMAGTLFEQCAELTEVETVRNHIIHDGLLDDMPKVYRVIASGSCVEKYILFPDRNTEGRFDSFNNRNLFYGNEDKINLRLPTLVTNFQLRLLLTLQLLLAKISDKAR
ncbi:hypothetical protein V2K41_11925 [Pseudomonas alliivorans]|nr:hypothetical protein [Pseudomonas alliivorans]